MWITCWQCGQEVWAETQRDCRHCYAPTRRCGDCEYYVATDSTCTVLGVAIGQGEAQQPTRLSLSYSCQSWNPRAEALGRPSERRPAPPVMPAPAAVPPQAPANGAAPATLEEVEIITLRREPPLRPPRHPLIIAHRGASVAAPENTLAAFRAALQAGAQAVELDLHLSRDGVPMVIHDATLERCTNGHGSVAELSAAELQALDAGNWFAPEFAGERIPSLDEALQALPAPTLLLLHLRCHENESDRCERAVTEAIARRQCRKRTIVSHHTRHGLHRLRELDAHLRLCWIPAGGEMGLEYIDDAYYMGYRIIQPTLREVDERFVAYAREKRMWVNVFWADEVADMQRLVSLGVQGILTNFPERLREVLKKAG